MSTKTIMILCVALFAVVYSMPASKQAAPAEDMKTAETIWAPSALLGYRSAYTLPSAALNFRTAYTMPSTSLSFHTAYNTPFAFRSAAIPAHYSGWNDASPMVYSSLLDADCL